METMSTPKAMGRLLVPTLLLLSCTTLVLAHDLRDSRARSAVVGTDVCQACFPRSSLKTDRVVGGATVTIECLGVNIRFCKEVRTNKRGVFVLRLPAKVGEHIDRIKNCSVKLIYSKSPFCIVASSSSTLRFKKWRGWLRVYSVGLITFKPLKQPSFCNLRPTTTDNSVGSMKFPFPPNPFEPPSLFPPNPFQPSPSLLPPNPFAPPPSLFPPNPFLASPPPFFSLPPITSLIPPSPPPPFFHLPPFMFPSLNPPSPPPPPPTFHLPPFPFVPSPLFPGNPPAAPSKHNVDPKA